MGNICIYKPKETPKPTPDHVFIFRTINRQIDMPDQFIYQNILTKDYVVTIIRPTKQFNELYTGQEIGCG